MTRRADHNVGELNDPVIAESNRTQMLDVLLALDRMVIEVSMRVYNLPRRDRSVMREQNRRLHDAVREHVPGLSRR